jgi:hypothetical protein
MAAQRRSEDQSALGYGTVASGPEEGAAFSAGQLGHEKDTAKILLRESVDF